MMKLAMTTAWLTLSGTFCNLERNAGPEPLDDPVAILVNAQCSGNAGYRQGRHGRGPISGSLDLKLLLRGERTVELKVKHLDAPALNRLKICSDE